MSDFPDLKIMHSAFNAAGLTVEFFPPEEGDPERWWNAVVVIDGDRYCGAAQDSPLLALVDLAHNLPDLPTDLQWLAGHAARQALLGGKPH